MRSDFDKQWDAALTDPPLVEADRLMPDDTWLDRIRNGLQRAAEERAEADERFVAATRDLEYWLRRAHDDKDMSMTEAANLAGVSRKTAYAMAEAAITQPPPTSVSVM